MKYLRLLLFILLTTFIGCSSERSGTDTGPEGVVAHQDETPATDSVQLFSKSTDFKDPNWIDTGAYNSLDEVDRMEYESINGERVYATRIAAQDILTKNTHSHYVSDESSEWSNYQITGKMMIDESAGSIGVTFYSGYPFTDTYYRIRRFSGHPNVQNEAFHFSASSNDKGACSNMDGSSGNPYTDIVPAAGQWYLFKVQIENQSSHTLIHVKIWPESESAPSDWQIVCYDYRDSRLSKGTVGVWNGTTKNEYNTDFGKKYFDDFKVYLNRLHH